MKIIHTSDWHLGRRVAGKSRISEQEKILREITLVAKREEADALILSGDVFDTAVPPSEAERLFYRAALDIAAICPVIVLSGNHDDALRLKAPDSLALAAGIILGADGERTEFVAANGVCVTVDGFVKLTNKNGETANVAIVDYPTQAKLAALAEKENYVDCVRRLVADATACFRDGEMNILASHLFVLGSGGEGLGERELGGSKLVPADVLTVDRCDYVALGHVHKAMAVKKSNRIYYSGSIAQYSFDDGYQKSVNVVEKTGDEVVVRTIELTSYRKMKKITARSEEEIEDALNDNEEDYIFVRYDSLQPLSSSALSSFRRHDCYCGIEVVARESSAQEKRRSGLSDGELFRQFYMKKTGKEPSEFATDVFFDAVGALEEN